MAPAEGRRARRRQRRGERRSGRRRVLVRALAFGLAAGVVAAAVVWIAALAGWTHTDAAVPVGVVAAAVVGADAFLQGRRKRSGAKERKLRNRIARLEKAVGTRGDQLAALTQLAALSDPYPLPFGGWAMTPDALTALLREAQQVGAGAVLELGSGVSTLVLGRFFARRGDGIVVALEADAAWAEQTRRHIAAMGIGGHAIVVDAPLEDTPVGTERYRWYQLSPAAELHRPYDLLLVDGPPQRTDPDGSPRYPALPLLHTWLSPAAEVIVDDATRGAEMRMLDRWATELPAWTRRNVATQKGMAVLQRTGSDAPKG